MKSSPQFIPKERFKQSFIASSLLVVLAAIGLWVHALTEASTAKILTESPLICPLKRFTGLKCAFCGMTHAWIALFQGRFAEAWQQNILSIPLFSVIVTLLVLAALKKLPNFALRTRRNAGIASLSILMLYAILRNL